MVFCLHFDLTYPTSRNVMLTSYPEHAKRDHIPHVMYYLDHNQSQEKIMIYVWLEQPYLPDRIIRQKSTSIQFKLRMIKSMLTVPSMGIATYCE